MTSLFDHPLVFSWSQKMVPFTVWVYRDLMRTHIPWRTDQHLLDIGCGVGAHAEFFGGAYTGIDFNPDYIAMANARRKGDFRVMDGTRLTFSDGVFDTAVALAIFHHLSDEQVRASLSEAMRVLRPGGHLHVIDPILPTRNSRFKRWLFLHDRGRFPRTIDRMKELMESCHSVSARDLRHGVLHDVAYFGFTKES